MWRPIQKMRKKRRKMMLWWRKNRRRLMRRLNSHRTASIAMSLQQTATRRSIPQWQGFNLLLILYPRFLRNLWQFSESISVFQQVPGHTKKRRIVESDEDGEPQQHIDPGDYGRSRSSRIAKRHKASEPLSVTFPLYFFSNFTINRK